MYNNVLQKKEGGCAETRAALLYPSGTDPLAKRELMDDEALISRFVDYTAHNLGRSIATAQKYACYLRRLSKELAEQDLCLLDATLSHLDDHTGVNAHRAGYAPQSRHAMVSAVRGFYKWCERERLVVSNPAKNLEYPSSGKSLPRSITLKNAEALLMQPGLDTFIGCRDSAIIALLMGCGLRVSGLCALNERSLIWAQDSAGKEVLVLRVREKGKKERMVPVPREGKYLIRAYLGHEELAAIDRSLPDRDQVLFVSTRSSRVLEHEYRGEARRLRRGSIQALLLKYGRRIGIPEDELHPHAFRHLFGTELAEDRVDLLRIQALMGHVNPESSEVYVQLAVRQLADVVEVSSPLAKIKTPMTALVRKLEG